MTRASSPNEFLKQIEDIVYQKGMEGPDYELMHLQTDEAMEELLIDLGYGDAISLIRRELCNSKGY